MKKLLSKSSAQTKKLAARLAKKILNRKRSSAGIVALSGELGAGKTTFVQGFLRALGVKKRITSPTFLIFKPYNLAIKRYARVYHVDCYRIHKPAELLKLGFKKILDDHQNIVLIEWADKIKSLLPKRTIKIEFSHGRKENERFIAY